MEVQFGPNSVDEMNLLYKLQNKVKVFNTKDPLQNRGYNLVASSSKYGLVFIGVPDGTLTVYYLNQLIDKECDPQHMTVKLQEKPTHVSVSCDQELLAVTGGQQLCVYKITDFQNQNVSPSLSLKTEVNPSTFVSAIQWNPCIPDSLAIAFYDGTLIVYQLSTVQVKKIQSKARCICWSPKGKQLVTGNSDGTLCQYKPDLTLAKMIPAPNLFEGSPVEALALYWTSTFQFTVVYKNATDNSRPVVAVVNAGKTGQPTCLNYEDICYSMGNSRPWYYYLQGLAQWNIILASSSNSMEIATLGSVDGVNWSQWCQVDDARAELPLTDKKIENYPVGLCIDTCAIHQLPWDDNIILPHMPLLLVLSQSGLLIVFNIVNLNQNAPQICSPPQKLTLPANSMTRVVLDDTPQQPAEAPAQPIIVQPKQQTTPVQVVTVSSQPSNSGSFTNILTNNAGLQNFQQPQISSEISTVSANQVPIQKEIKPIVVPQPVQAQAETPNVNQSSNLTQVQENTALKAEQERLNKIKANQELKDMLVKEVNDFQMELYRFMLKTQETQAKLQRDIESINANFNPSTLDAEQLKKECSLDDLKAAVGQLKLELVRACAVVAEARTHADAKDLQQWTQADPLTVKRVASVKKLAYYVQTQLEQAQRSLDFKWNEIVARDPHFNKPGHRMIRPKLDDVYQPLVKQQEILSRQQAVLRTLRNTLKECEYAPVFKSSSLLRSTPFRNKDPLSKLTKNILNMSIEPQTKTKEALLSPQKFDALRDMLSNHKIIKIKPVSVELRQHLAKIRKNYEKSLQEKSLLQAQVEQIPLKVEPQVPKPEPMNVKTPTYIINAELKKEIIKPIPTMAPPTFTPVVNIKPKSSLGNVTRTLFADEIKQEIVRPQVQPVPRVQQQPSESMPQGFAPFNSTTASAATRTVLKDLLQSKSQANNDVKNDDNTFMGQNICSPLSFSFKPSSAAAPTTANIFSSKPVSNKNNVFSKFQPQTFVPEVKPQVAVNTKSNETGEPEGAQAVKGAEGKKTDKPLVNMFSTGTTQAAVFNASNIPDVLKSHQQEVPTETDVKIVHKETNKSEKTIENVPEVDKNISKIISESKENISKPIGDLSTTKSHILNSNFNQNVESSSDISSSDIDNIQKAEVIEIQGLVQKGIQKSEVATSKDSSIFTAANISVPTVPKPQSDFAPSSTPSVETELDTESTIKNTASSDLTTPKCSASEPVVKTSSSPSSVFATAVASQSKLTSPTGSIFSSSPASSTSGLFGSNTENSIFGSKTSANSIFSAAVQPAFTSEASKLSVFSTPTSTSPSSLFGAATKQSLSNVLDSTKQESAPTTTESAFGSASSTSSTFDELSKTEPVAFTTTSSLLSTTTSTAQVTEFGLAASTANTVSLTTTAAPVFASATTTTQSVFGTTPATQAPLYGSSTGQTSAFGFTSATQSIFGTPSTQTSVFGTPTSETQPSVFGTPTKTTQSSLFGTPTQTTQPSIFGTTTQTSVFGTPSTQISVFGTPTQTTQASLFGTPTTTNTQSGSLFGGAEANLFASASISTTNASQSSAANIFSGSASSGSVFGNNNTNIFGGKTAFGQPNTTAASIFGGGASFGQKSANNFWAGANANAGTTAFGSSSFGQQATTQASSIFGSSPGGSFSTPQQAAQPFGTPQKNTPFGGGESKPSVFSTPLQSGSAFGGPAAFGTTSGFGQPASFSSPTGGGFGAFGGFNKSPTSGFGAPATFGGAATFGGSAFGGSSPGKVFGGASPTPGFAQTQSNAMFESLASQNTLTFGNLAQQSNQQSQQTPSFNTSPSFTGWRG